MSSKVICFTGRKGSGKDTLADSICGNSYVWNQTSFAYSLKKTCSLIFPWLNEDYPSELKDIPLDNGFTTMSPRDVWKKMGGQHGPLRQIQPDIFIKRVETVISDNQHSNFIITDLREPLEHQWAIKNNYPIIKIISHFAGNDSDEDYIDTIQTPYCFDNLRTYDCINYFRFVFFPKVMKDLQNSY